MILKDSEIKEKIKRLKGSRAFVCTCSGSQWQSYDGFWEDVFELAGALRLSGGEKIAAAAENGILLFRLYFACMLSNTAVIPVDPQKGEDEIRQILGEHPGVRVFKDADLLSALKDADPAAAAETDFDAAVDAADLGRTFMITYTSGSTGRPKGVMHSLRNLFLAAWSFGSAAGLNENHTMCHVMPMTYMAGILNTIFMPFIRGCRIAVFPRFDVMSAVSFWKNVRKYEIDSFWLSPAMLTVLMAVDRQGKGRECLAGRKTLFFIGTAPLYDHVRERFEKLYGVELLQSYGLSETLFLSVQEPGADAGAAGAGRLLPEADAAAADDGELKADVPWMFLGYSSGDAGACFEGGYYLTGDLGTVTDGALNITGRKKDLIIKGGMKISPKQIEECILSLDMAADCAVSGIEAGSGERIVCWYVPAGRDEINEAELNREIEKRLGRACRVDCLKKVGEIPKNLNGKTDKKTLREKFGI